MGTIGEVRGKERVRYKWCKYRTYNCKHEDHGTQRNWFQIYPSKTGFLLHWLPIKLCISSSTQRQLLSVSDLSLYWSYDFLYPAEALKIGYVNAKAGHQEVWANDLITCFSKEDTQMTNRIWKTNQLNVTN